MLKITCFESKTFKITALKAKLLKFSKLHRFKSKTFKTGNNDDRFESADVGGARRGARVVG